jgi:hypothetical protein
MFGRNNAASLNVSQSHTGGLSDLPPQNRKARKILINTSHFVNNSPNTYRYYFPSSIHLKDNSSYLSVNKIAINNSTFNITETFGNNYFWIEWKDNDKKNYNS